MRVCAVHRDENDGEFRCPISHLTSTMKHPFQILISDKAGNHLFVAVKNNIYVYRISDGTLAGSWSDSVDLQSVQEKKFKEKREQAEAKGEATIDDGDVEQPAKKAKTNKKEPKVPVPGPGAPTIYNYIRSLTLSRDEKFVIGTTDSDKAAVIFQLDFSQDNCLSLIKRQVFPKRPCAVSTTIDDATLVVADKFGDVYSIPIDGAEPQDEKALVPILGHVSMLSDVLVAEHDNKQFVLTGDRDEHIKITNYPKSYVVKHWLFGHHEFVSCLHICDFDNSLLISGGGDDYLVLWKWFTTEKLARIDLRELVQPFLTQEHLPPARFLAEDSPMEISVTKVATCTVNNIHLIVVLCENTKCLLTFELQKDYTVKHKQTLTTENALVDFTIVNDSIFTAIDIESDDKLLEIFKFNAVSNLEQIDSDVTKKISASSNCEVEARTDFYPLYYISSLRKRSEH